MTMRTDSQSHSSDRQSSASPLLSAHTQAVKIQLTMDGRVWFSSYAYGLGDGNYKLNSIKRYRIDTTKAQKILSTFSQYFYEHFVSCFATDVGFWTLRITTVDGTFSHFEGSLCDDFELDGVDLSDLLRNTLNLKSLWGFKET